jgi:hypothetical protein
MSTSIQTTQAQCSQPSNLNSSVLASGTASIRWAAVQGAANYIVQYRVNGSTVWTNGGTVATTNQVLAGLLPETVYQWRVRANCSTFSSVAFFNSSGAVGGNVSCSQPSNTNATGVTETTADLSWSSILGSLYYTVQYRAKNALTWTNAGSVPGLALTISGLTAGTEYEWRVKASCSVYSSVATFTTVMIGGGSTDCQPPSNTNLVSTTPNSATISWAPEFGATSYTVEYRLETSTIFTTAGTFTGTETTLTGLMPATKYAWRVKANCSQFSSDAQFETAASTTGGGGGGGSTSCSSPSNTNVLAVTANSVTVNWEAQGGALNYTVQYRRELGGMTYTTVGTFTTPEATITGLSPLTKYVWRVKANCSPYGSDVQFETTASAFMRQNTQTNSAQLALSVYPNPAKGETVQIEAEQNARLQIVSITGQVIENIVMTNPIHTLRVGQLPNGLYMIQMQSTDGSKQTKKLLVSH